jgi:probable phosphoglycerate mutase
MTTIFLVRHGRTALNAEGRFRGRLDPPLDDRGFAASGPVVEGAVLRGISRWP